MDQRYTVALDAVQAAFGKQPRPVHFVDWQHCGECAEHEATLQAHTPATIGLAELGNAGWDPVCFVSADGYRYWFPALVRLALETDLYLDQFLFHAEAQLASLDAGHQAALRAVAVHLLDTRLDAVSGNEWSVHALGRLIDRLGEGPG